MKDASPCLGCTERRITTDATGKVVTCHCSCERFHEWHDGRLAEIRKIKSEYRSKNLVDDYVRNNVTKVKRRLNKAKRK